MFEVSSLPSLWFYRKTMVDHLEKKNHVTFYKIKKECACFLS